MDDIKHFIGLQKDDEVPPLTIILPPVIDSKEEALDTLLMEKQTSNEHSNVK
jgi:hypothetical protein